MKRRAAARRKKAWLKIWKKKRRRGGGSVKEKKENEGKRTTIFSGVDHLGRLTQPVAISCCRRHRKAAGAPSGVVVKRKIDVERLALKFNEGDIWHRKQWRGWRQ